MKITNPPDVKSLLLKYSQANDEPMPSDSKRGAMIGHLNKALTRLNNDVDLDRRILFGFFFTPLDKPMQPISSKDLTPGEWYAISRWIGAYCDEEQNWQTRIEFPFEAQLCVNWAKWYLNLTESDKKVGKTTSLGELEEYRKYGYGPGEVEENGIVGDGIRLGAVAQNCNTLPKPVFNTDDIQVVSDFLDDKEKIINDKMKEVEDPGLVPI